MIIRENTQNAPRTSGMIQYASPQKAATRIRNPPIFRKLRKDSLKACIAKQTRLATRLIFRQNEKIAPVPTLENTSRVVLPRIAS